MTPCPDFITHKSKMKGEPFETLATTYPGTTSLLIGFTIGMIIARTQWPQLWPEFGMFSAILIILGFITFYTFFMGLPIVFGKLIGVLDES